MKKFGTQIRKIWRWLPKWSRRMISVISVLFIAFGLSSLFFPLKVHIEYAQTVTDAEGKTLHAYLAYDDKWRMKLSPEEISPELEKAILFKEDRYFYYHPGVNPIAVTRALYRNIVTGRRTSGASTITMQLARLLEPKPRTYGNKVIEMFRALQLEWRYSKAEILTLYLNLVPYGGNIEGIKSASELYFQKPPSQLSLAEIATLVVIPNRPTTLSLDRGTDEIRLARDKWLTAFQQAEIFPPAQIESALSEPILQMKRRVPRNAPHLSRRLRQAFPTEPVIQSTLSRNLQFQAEKLVRDHTRQLSLMGIKNAAAIIVDNRQHKVVAYVGSADFFNTYDGGQVDGISAIRAPGSTLKPLLYGIAMDEGMVTPRSILLDIPVLYGTYEPENYDGTFRGEITLSEALAQSLNIPAVRLLEELSVEHFVKMLSKAGFQQIEQSAEDLGLSVVLGGCGTSLEELTRLYSGFANGGKVSSLRYLADSPAQTETEVLSPAASYMITQILTELSRPDLPIEWHNAANLPKVAWKTGTSYGRRDAWSIGYTPDYTVGVWVGNFSGEGVPGLYGAGIAAPLLFQLFNQLPQSDSSSWFSVPEALVFREVCSESGNLPEAFCENRVLDMAIPGISPYRPCEHMRAVPIRPDSSLSYCTHCLPDTGYVTEWFPNHDAELLTFYHQKQIAYSPTPPHNPDCDRVFVVGSPLITSPSDGLTYYIPEGEEKPMMLSSDVGEEVERVYWYLNDRFMGSMPARKPLFVNPPLGKVKISCSDDKGRNTDILVEVKKMR